MLLLTFFSIMFCGSADGTFLPPMVIYKGKKLKDVWTNDGPENCMYQCTESGWFDKATFIQWFYEVSK